MTNRAVCLQLIKQYSKHTELLVPTLVVPVFKSYSNISPLIPPEINLFPIHSKASTEVPEPGIT